MLKLLQLLFIGHIHKWVVHKELRCDNYTWTSGDKPQSSQHTIIQKCEGCGKLQEFTFTQGCAI